MAKEYMTALELNAPHVDFENSTIHFNFAAEVTDMEDRAIVDACVEAARKAGVTKLYLIDKRFLIEAIMDKLKKEYGGAEG